MSESCSAFGTFKFDGWCRVRRNESALTPDDFHDLWRLLPRADGAAALVGAGDPRGRADQQRGAHEPQPDGAHQTRVLRGAPHSHHAFRRGRLHHPDRQVQR